MSNENDEIDAVKIAFDKWYNTQGWDQWDYELQQFSAEFVMEFAEQYAAFRISELEAENKRLREEQLFQNAINQFIGYGFGKHQDLIDMVASMGLTKDEWDRWKKECRPSRDLTTYDIRDIDDYFSTFPQSPKEQ